MSDEMDRAREAAFAELLRQHPSADDFSGIRTAVMTYDAFNLRAVIDAFLAALNKGGLVVVPREKLVETLARSFAAEGHSLSAESPVPVYKDGTDVILRYEPYWKFHKYDEKAKKVIAAMIEAAPSS